VLSCVFCLSLCFLNTKSNFINEIYPIFFTHKEERRQKGYKIEWIEFVFYHPIFEVLQSDGRIRRWAYIEEVDKYLRIIILEDSITIHNAFFDRNFKPNEL